MSEKTLFIFIPISGLTTEYHTFDINGLEVCVSLQEATQYKVSEARWKGCSDKPDNTKRENLSKLKSTKKQDTFDNSKLFNWCYQNGLDKETIQNAGGQFPVGTVATNPTLMGNVEKMTSGFDCPYCKQSVSLMTKCTVNRGTYHTDIKLEKK